MDPVSSETSYGALRVLLSNRRSLKAAKRSRSLSRAAGTSPGIPATCILSLVTPKDRDGTGKEEARGQENHFCQTSQKDGKRQKAPQVRRHPAAEGGDSNFHASGELTTQARGSLHATLAWSLARCSSDRDRRLVAGITCPAFGILRQPAGRMLRSSTRAAMATSREGQAFGLMWITSPRASISTNCTMRFVRVSGCTAVCTRHRTA